MINFQRPYNRENFLHFLDNFLPDDFIQDEQKISLSRSFAKIKQAIKLGESANLGSVKGFPLTVYEIRHESENDPRVSLTREMFSLLRDQLIDRALIIFYSLNSPNYRFSLMKSEVEPKGRRVKTSFSHPRRFSFYLGPDAKTHTPEQFLLKNGQVKNFEELAERFNVEVVTKDFFAKYKQLFEKLTDHLQKNHSFKIFAQNNYLDIKNFSKKLLGQIVFIYFLQKKGWLGASKNKLLKQGDKNFLRDLFNKSRQEKKNFFRNYLEPLFYNALNKKPDSVDTFYRSEFDCQIPFLNGGLFEPDYNWQEAFIHLPDELFSSRSDKSAIGEGILDIFDLYNFTVYEDDSTDREVSIDPEMLGKVFENLLAENLRKGKGTYYTPREIVHYMCRESLTNYLVAASDLPARKIREYINYANTDFADLDKKWQAESFKPGQFKKIDDLLANIKIVDPACGSGAFLVGMLQEIVRLRIFLQLTPDSELFLDQSENTIKELPEYQLKKETIQNCIYGVDIDSGAIEIAKLRLWLSLVVDYELKDIEPLPNLDYKVMQGNSLIEELVLGDASIKLFDTSTVFGVKKMKNLFEEDKKADLFGEADKQQAIIQKLNQMHKDYFALNEIAKKHRLKEEIDKIEYSLIEHSVQKELKKLDLQNKNLGDYITPGIGMQKEHAVKFQKNISTQAQIMNVLDDLKNSGVKPFFLWHLNFAEVFENKGGFDVVIANPPYNAKLNKNEKKLYKAKYESIKTGRQDTAAIFVELAKRIGTPQMELSYILPYRLFSRKRNHGQFQIYTLHNYSIRKILYLGSNIGFTASDEFMILLMTAKNINSNKIEVVFKPDIEYLNSIKFFKVNQNLFIERAEINLNLVKFDPSLISKIEEETAQLGTICHVKDGIVPFLRKKLINERRIDERYVKFAGIAGRYILQKYYFNYDELYLCYDINEAKKYIKDPVELRKVQLREKEIFLHRKILTAQNSAILKGAIDEGKVFVSNSLHSIYIRDEYQSQFALEYILALINSNLINYYHDSLRLKATDLHPQILVSNLKKLPIKEISKAEQKPFIKIVDKILAITKDDDYLQNPAKQTKVKKYEKQIDQMVYKFYSLTEEEIKIVENLK